MKLAWTAIIATLVGILALAPVGACDVRPDKNLTGGPDSIRTKDRIAACGHAKENRNVPPPVRDEVLKRYRLPTGAHPDYEIDHLIPLCLGGSNDLSNLWPQPRQRIEATWNVAAKERLEKRVCKLVCGPHRQIDIAEAQKDFATAQEVFASDWIEAYQKYFPKSTLTPPPPGPAPCTPPTGNNSPTEAEIKASCPTDTVVWVNLSSKKYHFSGYNNYGNTKNGKYMCERDAKAAGMIPAKNEKHP